jgi:hypothetical protein
MKQKLADELLASLEGKALVVSMDCGFNGARN